MDARPRAARGSRRERRTRQGSCKPRTASGRTATFPESALRDPQQKLVIAGSRRARPLRAGIALFEDRARWQSFVLAASGREGPPRSGHRYGQRLAPSPSVLVDERDACAIRRDQFRIVAAKSEAAFHVVLGRGSLSLGNEVTSLRAQALPHTDCRGHPFHRTPRRNKALPTSSGPLPSSQARWPALLLAPSCSPALRRPSA